MLGKPKSLAEVKTLTDAYIDGSPQEGSFKFGMALLEVPVAAQPGLIQRWQNAGSPPIREFVPYFRHLYGVDLFFKLAMASDQISRVRPAGKADNYVDMAYLYYRDERSSIEQPGRERVCNRTAELDRRV